MCTSEHSMDDQRRTVRGGRAVSGEIHVPGDKSISHRALMLAAIAEGKSIIRNLSSGEDVASTRQSLQGLGVRMEERDRALVVRGTELIEADEPLYLGNAGTAMRLMSGLLAGRPFLSILTGDASLRRRPMSRVLDPLSQMGAQLAARQRGLAPLVCLPSGLTGITYAVPMASAQVKSAVLLAGLRARGSTTVIESAPTRPHTEEMLSQFGAKIAIEDRKVTVWPSQLSAMDVDVPGDPSQAAFWVVAAAILPGSSVVLPSVEMSATRTGFLRVLERMGAAVRVENHDLIATYRQRLTPTTIHADEVPSLVDEVPILAVAAASAAGTSVFSDLGELVHKESNRLQAIHDMVNTIGAKCAIEGDRLVITGVERFREFEFDSRGDHRMAMSAAVAGLLGNGTSTVTDVACVATSYPGFFETLDARTTT